MKPRAYLGIDLGTTAVKAALFGADGRLLGVGSGEYRLETPRPDIVELEAKVYCRSCAMAVAAAMAMAGAVDLAAIALTGQVETLIAVDAEGAALRKAIVWLDNRAGKEAEELAAGTDGGELFRMTGQPGMLPCFPAPKILWLRRNEPELFRRTRRYLMVEDFIAWRMTGEYGSCRGLQPSSMYYDLRTGEYDPAMLGRLGIEAGQLPELREPGAVIGRTSGGVFGLPDGVPVAAAPLDHICGCLGGGGYGKGRASATIGCTLAVCAAFDHLVYDERRRIGTYCGMRRGDFALLPWAPAAGMLLKYFRDGFASGTDYRELDDLAAAVAPGSDGLTMLPHVAGSVAPAANPAARGVVYGVTLAHTRGHYVRAILESVAYLLRDQVGMLRGFGSEFKELRLLGGGAASGLWRRIFADVLEMPVAVPDCPESTSLGAAMAAAAGAGDFASPLEAAAAMAGGAERVEPGPEAGRYRELYGTYRELDDLLMPTFGGR